MSQSDSPRRRLTRSADHKLGGVCGGLAEYFGVDPTLVRVGFVLLAILSAGGGALLAYAVLRVIMPPPEAGAADVSTGRAPNSNAALVLGIVIVAIGVSMAVHGLEMFWWMTTSLFRFGWPAVLIAAGVLIILAARRR